MSVVQCKYHDLEIKALETKTMDELAECGCDRCQAVWDQKNYERLQELEQDLKLKQEAQKRGEQIGKILEEEAKQYQNQLEQYEVEAARNYLQKKGIDLDALAKAPFWNKVESKGVGSLSAKPFYINTGAGKNEYAMKLFERYLREGDQRALGELKDLNYDSGTATQGANVVPIDFLNRLVEKRYQQSVALRAGVQLLRISGQSIQIPVEGNAASGAWVTQTVPDIKAVSTDPSFNQLTLSPDDYAVMVAVSRQLLRDAGINLANYLTDHFGRVLAKQFDTSVFAGPTSGPGPKGIINDASITNTVPATDGSTSGKLIADNLIDAFFKLEPQYQENAVWIMNNFCANLVRKLKDSTGRYLWDIERGGVTEGVAGMLLGRPVYVTNTIPHDATNGDKIIIADMSYYYAAECGGVEIARDDSVYFYKNQVAFRAIMSLDGKVALPEAFSMVTGVKQI